jgi:hypothetical protein
LQAGERAADALVHGLVEHHQVDARWAIAGVRWVPVTRLVDRRDTRRRQRLDLGDAGGSAEPAGERRQGDAEIGGAAGVVRVIDEPALGGEDHGETGGERHLRFRIGTNSTVTNPRD